MQMINKTAVRAQVARPAARQVKTAAMPQKVAQVAGVALSSLALTMSAHADAIVKAGSDSGGYGV
eukprot:279278-Pelagomonas_calceolata.AAC.2